MLQAEPRESRCPVIKVKVSCVPPGEPQGIPSAMSGHCTAAAPGAEGTGVAVAQGFRSCQQPCAGAQTEVRRTVRSGLSPQPLHFPGSAAAPVADVPGWGSLCSGCCGGDGPAVVG